MTQIFYEFGEYSLYYKKYGRYVYTMRWTSTMMPLYHALKVWEVENNTVKVVKDRHPVDGFVPTLEDVVAFKLKAIHVDNL